MAIETFPDSRVLYPSPHSMDPSPVTLDGSMDSQHFVHSCAYRLCPSGFCCKLSGPSSAWLLLVPSILGPEGVKEGRPLYSRGQREHGLETSIDASVLILVLSSNKGLGQFYPKLTKVELCTQTCAISSKVA